MMGLRNHNQPLQPGEALSPTLLELTYKNSLGRAIVFECPKRYNHS